MKNFRIIPVTAFLMLALITAQAASAGIKTDKKKNVQQTVLSVRGKVVDKETLSPLVFASVSIKGTNIATVTNIDGEFLIKYGEADASKSLEIAFLGYKNKLIPLSEMRDNGFKNNISMEAAPIPLKEIIIKPILPDDIVTKAITSISKNYPNIPNLMTAFYRETIRKNRT
jgi:hypothetical protein